MTLRTALPFGLGLAALIALGAGCDTGPLDDPESAAANQNELTGMIEIAMNTRWNCGEYGADPGELPEGVLFDEWESEYVVEQSVELGPIEDCLLPYNERPATATCRWNAPSDCWDIDIAITQKDGILMLSADMSAGDADTMSYQSLPLSSVPLEAPWSIDYTPDAASGSWGHVGLALRRVTTTSDCSVACTIGNPCGDTCIDADLECHQPDGRACMAD